MADRGALDPNANGVFARETTRNGCLAVGTRSWRTMLEIALTSFTTFFATIGPVEAAVLFATLTPKMTARARAAIAVRATVIASLILLIFTFLGQPVLDQLGVTIPALQTAGGIILLIIALDMIFARPTSAFKLTQMEDAEAQTKDDIAVFPLATPLLAGPGAMSAGILLAANAETAMSSFVCASASSIWVSSELAIVFSLDQMPPDRDSTHESS